MWLENRWRKKSTYFRRCWMVRVSTSVSSWGWLRLHSTCSQTFRLSCICVGHWSNLFEENNRKKVNTYIHFFDLGNFWKQIKIPMVHHPFCWLCDSISPFVWINSKLEPFILFEWLLFYSVLSRNIPQILCYPLFTMLNLFWKRKHKLNYNFNLNERRKKNLIEIAIFFYVYVNYVLDPSDLI